MANNLTVAWARPVDTVKLGARLEAYVDARAVITTLRMCAKYAPLDFFLAKLPPELISIIGALAQDAVYEDHRQSWELAWKCCQGTCCSKHHRSKQEQIALARQHSSRSWNPWDNIDDPRNVGGIYFEAGQHRSGQDKITHHHRVKALLDKLNQKFETSRSNPRFARCREVWALG